MNRRELLLGVVAAAVAAVVPEVEATATWREIHDGVLFDLGSGDKVPKDGKWHHVLVMDGVTYVDGVVDRPLVITDESVAEIA